MSLLVDIFLYGSGLLGFLLLLLVFKQLVHCLWLFGIFKRKGIPGPKPTLLVGNLFQLRSCQDPNQLIEKWLNRYGNVFGYFFGSEPFLVVNDVEVIKEVMVRQHRQFRNRAPLFIQVLPLCRSLLAAEDDHWKAQRKIISPAFSPAKLRPMADTINDCVDVFLEEVARTEGREFEAYQRVQTLTLDVIASCALAMKLDCQRNPEDNFFRAVKEYFEMCENLVVKAAAVFQPLASVFRVINDNLTAGKMTDEILENLKKVIALRRNDGKTRVDLLQLMLDSAEEAKNSPDAGHMDDYCAMANAHFFLLAGYETTATALVFSLYLLAKHQDVQEKLFQEVRDQLRTTARPSYEDVTKMQYLDQVLNESMRIYPPVTLFITRHIKEDCEVAGLKIPGGVILQLPVWHIHHDPQHYPDPWTFDPERFSPERKEQVNPYAFLPFGVGPRNCVGMKFAQLEAKLALARLIARFRIQLSPLTEDPLQLSCPTVITQPKNGVYITATPR